MSELPPGFVLDQPSATPQAQALPPGFQLDAPPADGGYLSDIGPEIKNAFNQNVEAIKKGLLPNGDPSSKTGITGLLNVGAGVAAIPGAIFSPVTGAARAIVGHGLADAEHAAGTVIAPQIAAKDNRQAMYEQAKSDTDKAMLGMGARAGMGRPPVAPTAPVPNGPLGVTLSEGQATRDLGAIQREQTALRAPSGMAGDRAQQFANQQAGEVANARDTVSRSLDPFGMKVAEGPQDAGQIVQQAIQTEAANRKAGVTQAYNQAKALPGEIEAGSFNGIGDKIKADLSAGPEPVVIDDKLTPFASHAIKDVENRIANLQIQNRASPHGQPPANQIAGVTLEGVDQMRKRLSAFRKDAYASGNSADGRAASAVVDAFDAHIDNAVNSGGFQGDPLAIKAWNTARAAHADYKQTFGKGKNDPVGRVVEKILGTRNSPAAIPNDVADFIYGSSGVNPGSLNVAVANRVKGILGPQSPEWSAVKQGLFSRLVETADGVKDIGSGTIAQRVSKFISGDGRELGQTVFNPAEQSLIKQYGELHRALEVPQAGAQWSNNAPILLQMLKKASTGVATVIGGLIGHFVAPGFHGAGEAVVGAAAAKVSGSIQSATQARQIAKQMPLVTESAKRFQRALAAYTRQNAPPTRVALSTATANLARSFQQIGVDLSAVSSGVGKAGDNQQEIPGVVPQ